MQTLSKAKAKPRPASFAERQRAFVEEKALAQVALLLTDALEASGLSQRALAGRLGVTEPRVSQILGADQSNLKLSTLARLADALGCELRIAMEPKKGQK